MKDQLHNFSFSRFLTLGPYEKEPDFRDLIESIAYRGMMTAGLLGGVSLLFFVLSHVFLLDKTVVWTYSDIDPQAEVMLLDKVLILFLCLACISASRMTLSLIWCRWLIFAVVWLVSLAILMDDIAARDISFSTAYITIALIIAVITMPYKGWQTGLIAIAIVITTELTILSARTFLNIPAVGPEPDQIIYLLLTAILLTGMSSLIYLTRYDQHRSRKRAEELSKQLEERAQILEQLKEKSEQQAKKILETDRIKDRFFTNISHEFRTPLTLILGPLKDTLEGRADSDNTYIKTEVLSRMYKNGRQLLDLINQLLDLSKIDAGGILLDKQKLNLTDLVHDTVLSFVPMAERNRIVLKNLSAEEAIFVWADQKQIERVIDNLLSNALKFTPAGGKVTVSVTKTEQREGKVQITVKDNGIGISADEIPNIFNRFYQSQNSSKIPHKGTGIGLSLVKEIVDLHEGTIQVNSEADSGSEFIVTLRDISEIANASGLNSNVKTETDSDIGQSFLSETAEDSYDMSDVVDEENEIPSGEAPVVMLIDDNPDILAYLETALSARYNVISLEKSSDALDLLRAKKADLIISDVMMPDPDGLELCKLIKKDPVLNHIPVILLTARVGEESKLEGLELGADDYICKPFSATELMARVENLIELRRILRERFSREVNIKGQEIDVSSADARFLERVQQVIDEHMANSNFSVDWLADEVNLSPRQFQRKMRAITNLSAAGYIRMLRLERARQLLEQGWGNVSEISYKVGFRDTRYFSRLFKQAFDLSPTDFLENRE